MSESIKEVLMRRDKMTAEEADKLINEAKADLENRIENGYIMSAFDICEEYFGLEEDYIPELMEDFL